jgi:hypothetical protein
MTAQELIESLQKLIAERPDVAGMYIMLCEDPTLCASEVRVVEDEYGEELVSIA